MGVICINCGWENQSYSSLCEKCKQVLNQNNSIQDLTSENHYSLHYEEESSITEAIEKIVINSRYELITLLHNDDYSEVWSAKDILTNEIISVKMALNANFNEIIFQEYSFLSNHRYAGFYNPLYYDLFEDKAFFVSLKIRGSLLDLMGFVDFDFVERFIAQLASLLMLLCKHQKFFGLLSPNCILVGTNQNINVMGNAFLQLVEKTPNKSKFSINRNTIPYLSPECFIEDKILRNHSIKSDIWSVGAIIYELVTRKLPFGPNGGKALTVGQCYNERFNFYSTAVIDFQRLSRLQYIVYRCLDKDPMNRPSPRFIRDSFIIRTIKSERKERLYSLVHPINGVVYSIECDKLSNLTAQVIPGAGPLPHLSQYFIGAFFEDGKECGYLKLEENGRISEYARMLKSHYKHLCQLT